MILETNKYASKLYDLATRIRNFGYEAGVLDSCHLSTPVISVGNLTFGGTGKTPITQMLIDYFTEQQKKAVVIGRNYKAQVVGTAQVDINRSFAAQYFGDEPTLLALRNPEVPIFVGPRKWETALYAQEKIRPDVIIIDDGFQHRALHRNLDIVLLDATVPISDYNLFPLGKGRESFENINRANIVLISKVNLASELMVEKIRSKIPSHIEYYELAYRLQGKVEEAGVTALAFSGIAKPESFKLSIQQDTLYNLVDFQVFSDHHIYTKNDIDNLIKKKNEIGAQVLLTTEKDWVKVKNLSGELDFIRVLELQTYFLSKQDEFYSRLLNVIN